MIADTGLLSTHAPRTIYLMWKPCVRYQPAGCGEICCCSYDGPLPVLVPRSTLHCDLCFLSPLGSFLWLPLHRWKRKPVGLICVLKIKVLLNFHHNTYRRSVKVQFWCNYYEVIKFHHEKAKKKEKSVICRRIYWMEWQKAGRNQGAADDQRVKAVGNCLEQPLTNHIKVTKEARMCCIILKALEPVLNIIYLTSCGSQIK